MDNKELEMLHVIDNLWQDLKTEPLGRITSHGIEPPDGYRFVRIAEEIADKVTLFCAQFSPSYFQPNLAGISSTVNDEVQRVRYAQEGLHRSRTTQSQRNEFNNSMDNVIDHYSRDFYGILQKIQELKTSGQWNKIDNNLEI